MDSTIEYYEEHAVEFIAETQKLKMDAFYEMFEKYDFRFGKWKRKG